MGTATESYRYARLRVKQFEVDVSAVVVGRAVYFPLRALCEVIGVATQMQIKRLKEDSRFADGALRELPIPTTKGLRDAICLRKQQVGTWLSSIEPSKVAITARGPLEEFQRALFAAAERFLFGDMSDAVLDAPERASKPIYGVLHLGDCPRCGLALCLTLDETGQHLAPDVAADEG